jgi:hypothetical protein
MFTSPSPPGRVGKHEMVHISLLIKDFRQTKHVLKAKFAGSLNRMPLKS